MIGDDLLVVAGRERSGRAQANDIIACTREWYEHDVKAVYEGRAAAAPQRSCAIDKIGRKKVTK